MNNRVMIIQDFFKVNDAIWRQTLFLSALCAAIAFLQIFYVLIFMVRYWFDKKKHIKKDVHSQGLEGTKEGYINLIKCVLASTKSQHYYTLVTDWFVVNEINTNNYTDDERKRLHDEIGLKEISLKLEKAIVEDIKGTECKDEEGEECQDKILSKIKELINKNDTDVPVSITLDETLLEEINEIKECNETLSKIKILIKKQRSLVDTTKWICIALKEILDEENGNNKIDSQPTLMELADKVHNSKEKLQKLSKNVDFGRNYMMREIDFHTEMITMTSRLKQINIGFDLSEETELRESRLPFKHLVEILRTVDDKPRLPKALEFSAVRKLKDGGGPGLPLSPIILSEKPWPGLQQKAFSYLWSFIIDLSLHWLNILVVVVFAKIIF